jgi:ribosomal protein L7/L12
MQSSNLLRSRHCLLRLRRRRLPPTVSSSPLFTLSALSGNAPPSSCRLTDSNARLFSSATNDPQQQQSASPPPRPPPVFKYPKAQDLFERITSKCSKEDVSVIAEEINTILGRTLRKNEFFYHGFGGRKIKGGKGKSAEEIEAEAAAAAVPVKTTFDLKLVGFDAAAKIKVIKEIRAIAGLGLKEAKEMVESAPKVIQKDLKPEQAQELKAKLEEIGAQIELV